MQLFASPRRGTYLPHVLANDRALRVPAPGGTLTVTISIGLALAAPGEALAELIRRTDAALYEAKRNGRDRAVPSP